MKKHFFVVRHGETEHNANGIYQGQMSDTSLNDRGRQQARNLIGKLQNKNIGAVWCSPLKRASETGEIIATALGLSTKVHKWLTEGNFGIAEGTPVTEVKSWEVYTKWRSSDSKYEDIGYTNGETKKQIRIRALQVLRDIAKVEPAENIVIASHGEIARQLNWAAGRLIQGVPNGTYSELILEDDKLYAAKDKLLLLSCCAPCSCAVIKTLAEAGHDFAVVFYNPNIRPLAEYEKRREENKRVCNLFGIDFIELEYDNERWCKLTQGLENEPERGKRCSICFYMRLKRVMEYALEHGYTAVASVLGVSRWKNLDQVNDSAVRASDESGMPYVEIEGRKHGMQELRANLIKELNLYNQIYCGCKPPLSQQEENKCKK